MISLQQFMKTGAMESVLSKGRLGQRLKAERILMQYAQFLQTELPIRLAHRIVDLDQVPQLRDMPSVQLVKGIYIQSFLELLQAPVPTSPDLEADFGNLLQDLYRNHSNVLLQMAQGAWEFRTLVKQGQIPETQLDPQARLLFAQEQECHAFLNRFYLSRIGIRVLAGQYLALRHQLLLGDTSDSGIEDFVVPFSSPATAASSNNNSNSNHNYYIGMICQHTSPYEIVQRAIQDARRLCIARFGDAPSVQIIGRLDLTFPYIPTHLHYILLELLKNAMRATMEHHHSGQSNSNSNAGRDTTKHQQHQHQNMPLITVIIADGTDNEDVIIKVMDEGGGIRRSQMDHIWSYLFTTADPNIQQDFLKPNHDNKNDKGVASAAAAGVGASPILAGLGYGLPMSRAYARYFGGDLDIISMEGYGTDAFCHLVRLGDKAPLPV
jgi:pyruvate dehydrogenase kinase 2/3/4